MMAAGSVKPKKLTIKFASQRIEGGPGIRSCEFGQRLPHDNEFDQKQFQHFKQKSSVQCSKKRGPSEVLESQSAKRQRMDRFATHQCAVLLKSLMRHPAGWVFNEPVDPVALNIPDYFSIILKPMDLGTVKSKLLKNQYAAMDEFAADVRLTFSNAKRYNPPENNVHQMAVELEDFFKTKWKSLVERWNCERTNTDNEKPLSRQGNEGCDTKQNGPRAPPLRIVVVPKKSNPSVEKMARSSSNSGVADAKPAKAAKNCVRKLPEQNLCTGANGEERRASGSASAKPLLITVPPKCGNCGKIGCQCRSVSDSSRAVRKLPEQNLCTGANGEERRASGSASAKPLLITVPPKCGNCGKIGCQCRSVSDSSRAMSDTSYERSTGRDPTPHTSKVNCVAKSMSASLVSKSDPESDGAVSALDDENACPSSQLNAPTTDAASGEGWEPDFDVQLSPSKALRAASLLRRFAGTISKAQQQSLLDQGDKWDPVKLQHEKERLEKRQREERLRIEAQIKAAETAARRQKEIEMKQQRDREREAARIALQKMEKTAEIGQNLEVLKELEKLCGCSLSYDLHVYYGRSGMVTGTSPQSGLGSPLEKLGLFIKDDFLDKDEDEDEDLNFDGEEGEIIS